MATTTHAIPVRTPRMDCPYYCLRLNLRPEKSPGLMTHITEGLQEADPFQDVIVKTEWHKEPPVPWYHHFVVYRAGQRVDMGVHVFRFRGTHHHSVCWQPIQYNPDNGGLFRDLCEAISQALCARGIVSEPAHFAGNNSDDVNDGRDADDTKISLYRDTTATASAATASSPPPTDAADFRMVHFIVLHYLRSGVEFNCLQAIEFLCWLPARYITQELAALLLQRALDDTHVGARLSAFSMLLFLLRTGQCPRDYVDATMVGTRPAVTHYARYTREIDYFYDALCVFLDT